MSKDHERTATDGLKTKLLNVAERLLTTTPLVTLPSLRSIARECNVSATAVYRYFDSQKDLILSVLTTRFADFEATILAADDSALSPEKRVQNIAQAYMVWGLENPGTYILLFESADQLGDDYVIGDAPSILMSRLTEILAKSQLTDMVPAIVPADAAERLWTYLHGLVSLRAHKPAHPWRRSGRDEVESLIMLFFAPAKFPR